MKPGDKQREMIDEKRLWQSAADTRYEQQGKAFTKEEVGKVNKKKTS